MKELLQIMERYHPGFAGACLIRQGNQTLLHDAWGLANRDFDLPNRTGTLFECASVTKVFTAVAVLLLVSRGQLSLEDKITAIIDLEGTSISPDITLWHLLTHTSGIGDDAEEEAGEDYAEIFKTVPNYNCRRCADVLPRFVHKPPNFAPGTGVRYNNCAFVLLGLAIEAVTGSVYQDFVCQQVFAPLGMRDSCFCAKDDPHPGRAEGYMALYGEAGEITGWKKNIYTFPPVGTAEGGAYTTVEDLDRLLRGLLLGNFLPSHLARALFSPQANFPRETSTGVWRTGFGFEFLMRGGEVFCLYKEGVDAGVNAITALFPQWDLTISMLANHDGPLFSIFHDMKEYLYGLAIAVPENKPNE